VPQVAGHAERVAHQPSLLRHHGEPFRIKDCSFADQGLASASLTASSFVITAASLAATAGRHSNQAEKADADKGMRESRAVV